jgi:tRNA (pseudouridine54-N1)-methyltransferase
MRSFVVIGQKATASDDFLMDDLPGTSGRLDVLLRCVRAATLYSHGLRRDVVVYLVLFGGPRAPRILRFDGKARFLRPDERSLATLARKMLATRADADARGFVEFRAGIAVASGGLSAVLADLRGASLYVLEEGAPDLRTERSLAHGDAAFFIGDHTGFDEATRTQLAEAHARAIGAGPVSLHAEDVVTIVSNELDRREALSGRDESVQKRNPGLT